VKPAKFFYPAPNLSLCRPKKRLKHKCFSPFLAPTFFYRNREEPVVGQIERKLQHHYIKFLTRTPELFKTVPGDIASRSKNGLFPERYDSGLEKKTAAIGMFWNRGCIIY